MILESTQTVDPSLQEIVEDTEEFPLFTCVSSYSILLPFDDVGINDARFSPDGSSALFISDDGIWCARLKFEKYEITETNSPEDSEWQIVDEEADIFMDEDETSHECLSEEATRWKFTKFRQVDLSKYQWSQRYNFNPDVNISMQYMSWSLDSTHVVVTSDSHPYLFVISVDYTKEDPVLVKHVIIIGGASFFLINYVQGLRIV